MAADRKYKDQYIVITGLVSDIGTSLDRAYITLDDQAEFSFVSVTCYFRDEEEIDKIVDLSKGDYVEIVGKVEGKFVGVSLDWCRFK